MRIAIMAAAIGLAAGAASAEDFKFASFFAPTHPYVSGAFEPFAKMVEEKSGGDLTVTIYNGGELGAGPAEQYARVLDGVAELGVSLPGYTASTFPLTLVAELPGVIDAGTGTADIWNSIELFQPEYRRAILVSLWSSAPNVLYTRDKAVRSPADIEGMKIRVPSRNTGLLVEAWGGTPVSMPVSEIYNSLQTGVIDGAMIDTTATRAFRLGEVAAYLTVGMDTTNSPFFILANRDAFNDLSEADRTALLEAGREASFLANATQLEVATDGVAAFAELDGHEVIELTADEAAAFNAAAEEVTAKVVAETGGSAQAIVDALKH